MKQFNAEEWDTGKEVLTKDGTKVRIICIDGPGPYSVIGFIGTHSNVDRWTDDGFFCVNRLAVELDLFFKPKTITKYATVITRGDGSKFLASNMSDTKEDALTGYNVKTVAKIEWEE
ncbi:MAG: hypothetical protein JKY67_08415 [Pseudomonadales bacterium]|nr:hypothetical protein [Pseudomonadales bacterium]